MGQFDRKFGGLYKAVCDDIYKFCEVMNFNPTWQQRQLFDAVMDAVMGRGPTRIAVKSGQGPGKTAASAIVGMWFAFRRHMALTVVTAPTMDQCRTVWVEECRKLMGNAEPWLQRFFNITKTKFEIAKTPKWGSVARTATRVENAQGLHATDMMVIGEETSGISREMMEQFLGTLSNQNAVMVLIGNPNARDSFFFDCFHTQRAHWRCFTWNAEDTARDYPWIVNPARNKIFEDMFGRDSDAYRIRVLGEFPHADPNSVISGEELQKCMHKDRLMPCVLMPRSINHGGGLARQFGLDVARYGGDENCLFRRSGNSLVEWARFAHTDPADTIDLAFKWQHDAGWKDQDTVYVVDASGMGQGVLHKFHRANKRVVEFHNGGASTTQAYDNRITEAYFHAAKLIRARECYIPMDNILASQLTNRKYFTTKKGKLILETKDDYMKRGFESPDRADAAVLALYDGIVSVGGIASGGATRRVGSSAKIR